MSFKKLLLLICLASPSINDLKAHFGICLNKSCQSLSLWPSQVIKTFDGGKCPCCKQLCSRLDSVYRKTVKSTKTCLMQGNLCSNTKIMVFNPLNNILIITGCIDSKGEEFIHDKKPFIQVQVFKRCVNTICPKKNFIIIDDNQEFCKACQLCLFDIEEKTQNKLLDGLEINFKLSNNRLLQKKESYPCPEQPFCHNEKLLNKKNSVIGCKNADGIIFLHKGP